MTKETEYKERIASAYLSGIKRHAEDPDLEGYPADVREVLKLVSKLWNLMPPKTKKSKAYWIQSGRELLDACGEFGASIVEDYRKEFEAYMHSHNGIAPFRVEGPNSLVKSVRALAGEMRGRVDDRQRYVSGKYADWIEH